MRRFKQQLSTKECVEILNETTSGVLSLCGDDKQPYGVPLSHVYFDGKLIFHCALTGYKIDLLKQNEKVSFTVIAQDELHPEKYTTYFRSVIVSGFIKIIEDDEEKVVALQVLGRKCNSVDKEGLDREIARGLSHCLILEMAIENMCGKQAIELVNSL